MLSIILVAAFVCHIASAIVVPERKDINSFMVGPPDPGYDRDISDIVRDENYTFESHEVITEDGYIIEGIFIHSTTYLFHTNLRLTGTLHLKIWGLKTCLL